MAENNKQVKIPRQVRLKTEFFVGYGVEELIKTVLVGVFAVIVAYIVYKITGQTLVSTLIVIGAIAISVVALIKSNNNFSMVDIMKNIIKYELMQKEYRYERNSITTRKQKM